MTESRDNIRQSDNIRKEHYMAVRFQGAFQ